MIDVSEYKLVLINFGDRKLQGERYFYSEIDNECTMLNKDMQKIYNDVNAFNNDSITD